MQPEPGQSSAGKGAIKKILVKKWKYFRAVQHKEREKPSGLALPMSNAQVHSLEASII